MSKRSIILLALAIAGLVAQAGVLDAQQAEALLPAFVITDTPGTVVGAYSESSTQGLVSVLLTNSANGENFQIQVGTQFVRGADSGDVWYSNVDCTGTAYVSPPSALSSAIAGLRGSVYAIGRKAGASAEDCVILRGVGAGSDQNGLINSRYRTNANSGPVCSETDPGVNTVTATVVDDTFFCGLTRPFKTQ